jgi:hypothetical protein
MGIFSFFKGIFSKDTVEKIDDAVGEAIVETGKALAQAEVNKALDDLEAECQGIGDPGRRAAVLVGVGSLRVAVNALIASLGDAE